MHGTLFWWVRTQSAEGPEPRSEGLEKQGNKFKRSSFGRTLAVNLCGTAKESAFR